MHLIENDHRKHLEIAVKSDMATWLGSSDGISEDVTALAITLRLTQSRCSRVLTAVEGKDETTRSGAGLPELSPAEE